MINTMITAEMTSKFNLSGLILKNFQQSVWYIASKYKLTKITLKFNLRRSNSLKFPVIRKVYSH